MRLPILLFSVLATALAVEAIINAVSQKHLIRRGLGESPDSSSVQVNVAKRGSKVSKCLGSCGRKSSTSSPQRTSPAHHGPQTARPSSSSSSTSSSPRHRPTRPTAAGPSSRGAHTSSSSRQAYMGAPPASASSTRPQRDARWPMPVIRLGPGSPTRRPRGGAAGPSSRGAHTASSSRQAYPGAPSASTSSTRPQGVARRPMPVIRPVPARQHPRFSFGRGHWMAQQENGDRFRALRGAARGGYEPAHPSEQLRLGRTYGGRVDHDLEAVRARLRSVRTRIERASPITSSGSSDGSSGTSRNRGRSRTRRPNGSPTPPPPPSSSSSSSSSAVRSGTSFGSKSRQGSTPSTPSSSGSSNDIGRHGSRVASTPTSYSPSPSSSSRSSDQTAPSPLPRLPKGVKGSRILRIKHDAPHPITGKRPSPPTSPGSVGSPSHPSRSSSSGSTTYHTASATSIPHHSSSSSPGSSPSPERMRQIDKGKAPKLPSSSSSRSSSSSPGWHPAHPPSGAGPSRYTHH